MRLFKWALGLLIVTLLLTGSVVYGSRRLLANQMKPAVREFAAQMCEPQPCWHGIRVGITPFLQAQDAIESDTSLQIGKNIYAQELCWRKLSKVNTSGCFGAGVNAVVDWFNYFTDDLSLIDMFSLYGEPVTVSHCVLFREGYTVILSTLIFSGDIWVDVISNALPDTEPYPSGLRLNPNAPVTFISYGDGSMAVIPPKARSWKGFASLPEPPPC